MLELLRTTLWIDRDRMLFDTVTGAAIAQVDRYSELGHLINVVTGSCPGGYLRGASAITPVGQAMLLLPDMASTLSSLMLTEIARSDVLTEARRSLFS